MGEPGWPPLALFKALLLSVWYDLSDVKLAEALDDRASFRRFCGFASDEPTPERTAFVRFRRELVARSLDRGLFEAVTNQLDAAGVVVKTGTLVDATVIASASLKDEQASWAGHRRRKPVHGYKAHVATDQEGGLIRCVEVTSANVHDGTVLEAVLPDEPGDVYADSASAARRFTDVMLARGGRADKSSRPAPGAGKRRWCACRRGTRRSGVFAAGSRRCSGPASAAMGCGGCAGWGWPRPACRCGSRLWPTTCAVR